MSGRILSNQLPACAGLPVRLCGWVHRIRNFGGVRFLVLRDRAGMAQVVVPTHLDLREATSEAVVSTEGVVRAEERAPGGFEVHATAVNVISPAEGPPFEIFKPVKTEQLQLETLLDHRALSLRIPDVLDVFRVQAEIVRCFRSYLNEQGFTEISTPKLVLAGAEGGAAIFEVKYFDRKAYLGQSPQFYKQIMVGSGLERVFEVGHAYRAEKSETSRHLTEFVSLDFEMGFIEGIHDVIAMHEGVMLAILAGLRERCRSVLARRKITLPNIKGIPIIAFTEAKRILADHYNKTRGLDGDLDTEGERLIGDWAREKLGSDLVFITEYETHVRPAYAMPLAHSPQATASFDLLYKGVEITTGGQRIHHYHQLVESFKHRGYESADYEDYLAAFKHGMPPHGGMGMGLERLTKQLLGLSNIKEASLFPRDRHRLRP
jgi:nondiscriminating aspartyl-tRNA synthetase